MKQAVSVTCDKVFEVGFDYYSTVPDEGGVFLPFGAHPAARIRNLEPKDFDASARRTIGIFCAGNLSGASYNNPSLIATFNTPSRTQIINWTAEMFSPRIVATTSDFKTGLKDHLNHIVLLDQATDGLSLGEYFSALRDAEFVLCPPGVNHPHCHNIFEGMACGCIPILGYDNWMRPRLQNGINCITFSDKPSFADAILRALRSTAGERARLRDGVIRYYDSFVRPNVVVEQMVAKAKRVRVLNERHSVRYLGG
ncbi:glycosyltransferase [Rosistilla carotiformis]|uniref:glycosyltransferase n=1 Tax=Rosistilla carotiformis TaxID=2528017 RepID=UPI0018D20F3B|nr:glycosyltransferase [Rosistilla carotiformis]